MVGITIADRRAPLASAKVVKTLPKTMAEGPTAGPSCPLSGHVVAGITTLAN
jgi:hypothetical protein